MVALAGYGGDMRVQNTIAAAMLVGFLMPNGSAVAAPDGAKTASAECRRSPKMSETPPGGHWYYRTDRATKRRCWFLGEASTHRKTHKVVAAKPAKPSHSAAADPDAATKEADTAPKTALQSFDNARAEMTSADTAPGDDRLQDSVWPVIADTSQTKSASTDAGSDAVAPLQPVTSPYAQNGFAPGPAVADAQPPARVIPATAQAAPQAAPAGATAKAEQPQAATAPPATRPASAPTSSLQPILAALASGLGLALILGGVGFKLIERRRAVIRIEDGPRGRRDIWGNAPPNDEMQESPAMSAPVDLDEAALGRTDLNKAAPKKAANSTLAPENAAPPLGTRVEEQASTEIAHRTAA